ncbi:MAG: phage portal protein [Mycobacteriaceae bacterium]|nr:phage portal protein [Mycobacteriaceae bacterium]
MPNWFTKRLPRNLTPPNDRGWWPMIRESFTGAWQQNVAIQVEDVLTYGTVYACITLIARDIAKMRLRLMALDDDGIWREVENPAFSPVLRKPNAYQTRIGFIEQWIISKLSRGNTYVLKRRDNRGVVTSLSVLDPGRVQVLVSEDGQVYYQLSSDNLSQLELDTVTVPSREIIHDVMTPLYHPLVGVSPIQACGIAAMQGLAIQSNSKRFFDQGSAPGGVLSAPGAISKETAARLKEYWDTNFTGNNVGKVAVLGDGLSFEPMTVNAVDAQLIEQLHWTAEHVCTAFHVPAYMVGVGDPPTYTNIEALNQQYYSQCLQGLIESIELLLDEGLELPKPYGTEFDLDGLLRMDSATLIDTEAKAVGGGIKSPNESRRRLNLPPVLGGETPYLQQQNYSLAALDRRDRATTPDQAPNDLTRRWQQKAAAAGLVTS